MHRTRYLRHTATIVKSCDPTALTVKAVLTTPTQDLEGDIVHPAGGVWVAKPYVNLDHNKSVQVGYGTVKLHKSDIGLLPVGTTHFTKGDRIAEQTYRLAEAGVWPGVSLEFEPIQHKSRGFKSILKGERDAYEYTRWKGLGWAHCGHTQAINPDAAVLEKAVLIAESRRIGSEPLSPVILKSLAPLVAKANQRPKSVRVPRTVGKKAMFEDDDQYTDTVQLPDDAGMDPPVAEDTPLPPADDAPAPDAAAESDTPPEASEAYDCAQMLTDFAAKLRERGGKTLHAKTRKQFPKLADELDSVAADLVSHAEAVEGELEGAAPAESESEPESEPASDDTPADESGPSVAAESDDSPPADDDSEEKSYKPLKRDAKGRLITKSGYVPKRFKLAGDKLVSTSSNLKSAIDQFEARVLALEAKSRRQARLGRR